MTKQPNVLRRARPRMLLISAAIALMHAGSASAQRAEDILLYKGPDREQKLIEGAKKEGQVVIYSALIVNQAMRPIAEKFGKKYPFVKLSYWRADSEDIAAKLSRRRHRRRAGPGNGRGRRRVHPRHDL